MYRHPEKKSLDFDRNRRRVKQCPCGKSNDDGKFVPYKGCNTEGYCHSCGKTFLPQLERPLSMDSSLQLPRPKRETDTIPWDLFEQERMKGSSLNQQNHFLQWLRNPAREPFTFDNEAIQWLIDTYYLCASAELRFRGWTMWPYIDVEGKVRQIKMMDYDPITGKRVQEPFAKIEFIGKKLIQKPNSNLSCCFLGEHLLRGNEKPVRIFEAETTAIYAAPFFAESICLATGGKNGCKWTTESAYKALVGRNVTLYPDIDSHSDWEKGATELRKGGIKVTVSDLILRGAQAFAAATGIPYADLVKQKWDMRDILKYKELKRT